MPLFTTRGKFPLFFSPQSEYSLREKRKKEKSYRSIPVMMYRIFEKERKEKEIKV